MPTLTWIGKDKVIKHCSEIPFCVLDKKYYFDANGENTLSLSLSECENNGNSDINSQILQSDNKIIHGDNLLALKSLIPEFGGKIKCIYIDPPYNTGNENWAYNDNVNDPKIKKWLNKVVGSDDLSRHDKWLCMIYPRLRLLHELLSKDGVIFISIDDNEMANLKLLCDEIFGERNFVANLIANSAPAGTQSSNFIAQQHSYCLVYAKKIEYVKIGRLNLNDNEILKKYNEKDKFGNFYTERIWKRGIGGRKEDVPSLHFPVFYDEKTKVIYIDDEVSNIENLIKIIPYQTIGVLGRWTWSREKMKNERDKLIVKKVNGEWKLHKKVYADNEQGKLLKSIIDSEFARTELGSLEVKEIMGGKVFDYPKPLNLIKLLLQISTDKSSIILDSFAGSGTTAHAVLELNKKDGGKRKFILVEMNDYANSTTAERVKRVIKGYGDKPNLTATGGSFEYFEIGEKLLLENGNLNEKVATKKIKEYIYFSETGQKLNSQNENYLLGIYENTAYYFIYEKDKSTSLNLEFLSNLVKAENYVIYADNHTLGENQLSKYKIKFKKIPRDIAKI